MKVEFSRPINIDQVDRHGKKEFIEATSDECIDLAKRFDLLSLNSFSANVTVKPASGGIKFEVKGTFSANLSQTSVVSGKPVNNTIENEISAWFADQTRVKSFEQAKRNRDRENYEIEQEIKPEAEEPEQVQNGIIDLGEVAAQFLGLAIDDFPRTDEESEGAGDYIEVKPEDTKPNPFAKLAELKVKK